MLTTSQTELVAGFVEDTGVVCVDCLYKVSNCDNLDDLRNWIAAQPEVSPIIEYTLHSDYAEPDGVYCAECYVALVDPYCPKCGGLIVDNLGESDDDGFLLCTDCTPA